MKLSKETIDILKNFASINLNILIKEGNVLTTQSPAKTIVSEVKVTEEFDKDFGIYDLSRFLGVLGLYNDPELDFDDKKITIKEGKNTTIYYGAEPMILSYPSKSINFPDTDIEFDVDYNDISKALKASAVLNCTTFSFEGDGEKIYILVSDPTEGTNQFKVDVGTTDQEFKANIKIDNIKFLPLDYKVSLSKKRIARLENSESDVKYYVALDATSTFN